MDRPVLLVDEGVLSRTPATQLRERTARLQIDVDESGAANYAYRVEDAGYTAELERNMFRRATRQRTQQIAANRLLQTGLHGTAQLRTGDLTSTDGPFSTSMQGRVRAFCLDRWDDRGAGLDELIRRNGGAGAGVAGGACEDAAVGVHRRGIR